MLESEQLPLVGFKGVLHGVKAVDIGAAVVKADVFMYIVLVPDRVFKRFYQMRAVLAHP